jgi:hypothetical protein
MGLALAVAGRNPVAAPSAAAAVQGSRGIAGDGMSLVDGLAVAYLALPVAVFFFTWLRPLYGIPLGLAALAGLPYLTGLRARIVCERTLAVGFAVALVWATLSGAGHFFYANYVDWHLRDAVLRDLTSLPAPATYRIDGDVATILRAPIGYFMVPALLGRIAGLGSAPWFLYLWTLAGVFLFLLQVLAGEKRWGALACIAGVVVLFSGMDSTQVSRGALLDITSYKEWWAWPLYCYPSNSAGLFWAPNHSLPAWLGIALIYRCRDDRRFLSIAAWVGALTLLWSPLASIGLLPFFLALVWRHRADGGWRPFFSLCNLIAAPLVAIPVVLFLMLAAQSIEPAAIADVDLLYRVRMYITFVLVEFGFLALALLRGHRDAIDPLFFGIAIAMLLALPLFHFGPTNDLVMRASVPSLLVLMFTVVDGWARPLRLWGRGALVTLLLIIGAGTPISEIGRVLLWHPWQLDMQLSLYDVTSGGQSPNYFAPLGSDSLLSRLLRQPTPSPLRSMAKNSP